MAELSGAIAEVLDGISVRELAGASQQLRDRYRGGSHTGTAMEEPEALAYAATRLPATSEAMYQALVAATRRLAFAEPSSQLDLGAGPGGAAWAAQAVWPSLAEVTLLEHDPAMLRLGKRLAASRAPAAVAVAACPRWRWELGDIAGRVLPRADVVTAGYVLDELDATTALAVAESAWRAARTLFAVVGPGTPAGFERMREVRDLLVGMGATILAPCPQDGPCPIEAPDWCHFAVRVERSVLHRKLKDARLGYEDEKFSYVAVSGGQLPATAPARGLHPRAEGRVLRHPTLRKRLVEVRLCCADGRIRTIRVGRSKAAYRSARSLRWGEAVGPELLGCQQGDGTAPLP